MKSRGAIGTAREKTLSIFLAQDYSTFYQQIPEKLPEKIGLLQPDRYCRQVDCDDDTDQLIIESNSLTGQSNQQGSLAKDRPLGIYKHWKLAS